MAGDSHSGRGVKSRRNVVHVCRKPACVGRGEFVNDVACVRNGAGEPVELGHDERVAAAAGGERLPLCGEILIDRTLGRSRSSALSRKFVCRLAPPSPGTITEPLLRDVGTPVWPGRGQSVSPCRLRFGGFWRLSQHMPVASGSLVVSSVAGSGVGGGRWIRAGMPTRQGRCASLRDRPAVGP